MYRHVKAAITVEIEFLTDIPARTPMDDHNLIVEVIQRNGLEEAIDRLKAHRGRITVDTK